MRPKSKMRVEQGCLILVNVRDRCRHLALIPDVKILNQWMPLLFPDDNDEMKFQITEWVETIRAFANKNKTILLDNTIWGTTAVLDEVTQLPIVEISEKGNIIII